MHRNVVTLIHPSIRLTVVLAAQVHLMEALGFICIYICYALLVFFDKQLAALLYAKFGDEDPDKAMDEYYDAEIVRYYSSPSSSVSDMESSASGGSRENTLMPASYDVFRIPNYHTADVYDSDSSSQGPPTLHRKTSAPTPRSDRYAARDLVLISQAYLYCVAPTCLCYGTNGH